MDRYSAASLRDEHASTHNLTQISSHAGKQELRPQHSTEHSRRLISSEQTSPRAGFGPASTVVDQPDKRDKLAIKLKRVSEQMCMAANVSMSTFFVCHPPTLRKRSIPQIRTAHVARQTEPTTSVPSFGNHGTHEDKLSYVAIGKYPQLLRFARDVIATLRNGNGVQDRQRINQFANLTRELSRRVATGSARKWPALRIVQ